jgi:hypothetical protein
MACQIEAERVEVVLLHGGLAIYPN